MASYTGVEETIIIDPEEMFEYVAFLRQQVGFAYNTSVDVSHSNEQCTVVLVPYSM